MMDIHQCIILEPSASTSDIHPRRCHYIDPHVTYFRPKCTAMSTTSLPQRLPQITRSPSSVPPSPRHLSPFYPAAHVPGTYRGQKVSLSGVSADAKLAMDGCISIYVDGGRRDGVSSMTRRKIDGHVGIGYRISPDMATKQSAFHCAMRYYLGRNLRFEYPSSMNLSLYCLWRKDRRLVCYACKLVE